MDDLSRHMSALQRLPPAEYEVLLLRAGKQSVDEIALRLGIEAREALARLALLYDSLWLAHLPQSRRRVELERYFAALGAIEAQAAGAVLHASDVPDVTPPRRALEAVEQDEQEMVVEPSPEPVVVAPAASQQPTPALPAIGPIARIEPVIAVPMEQRAFRLSRSAVLVAVLVLLALATILAMQMGDGDSGPALAASITPTIDVGIGMASTPTGTPVVNAAPTEPRPAATATPSPGLTATPTTPPTRTPTPSPTSTLTPSPAPTTPAPPTATLIPPTPTVADPTAVPAPMVAFEADWQAGLDGWTLTGEWRTEDGALERTETQGMATALAPHRPAETSYTIEAVMERIGGSTPAAIAGFALLESGATQPRVVAAPAGVAGPRVYRLEVSDGEMRFLIDGDLVSTAVSNDYLSPERVGLAVAGTGLRVHSFVIIE